MEQWSEVSRRDGTNERTVAFASDAPDIAVEVRLDRTGERAAWNVREVRLRANGDASLTGKAIREAPLGRLIALAQSRGGPDGGLEKSAARHNSPSQPRFYSPSDVSELRAFQSRTSDADRTDEDYAYLAAEYVMAIQEGHRAPARAIAEKFDGNARTWTNRLMEARRRGLLTPAPRSKAGGELTDKALDLLGITDEED